MRKRTLLVFLVFGLFSFVVGGLAHRAGFFSTIKNTLNSRFSTPIPEKTPTAIPTITEITPSFSFEFLDDPSIASMNNKRLEDDGKLLKFLVAGHIYGRPDQNNFHPALTFLTNLALFRDADFDMVFFLGDTVWVSGEEEFDQLEYFVLDRIDAPIFNAVGNHDVIKRAIYENRYGSTVFAFEYKNNVFIVLDTTLKYYDLTNDEINFVRTILDELSQTRPVENIHILMHHVLFLDDDEVIGKQIIKPNEGDGVSETFRRLLEEVIYPASEVTPVYIYAGDVGAFDGGNLSPFYKQDVSHNVRFLATGIGDTEADSVLMVEEGPEEELAITPFSLVGKEMRPITDYDFSYWLKK